MDKKVRRSALAGAWYDGSADGLSEQITGMLEEVPRRVAGDVTALIEPHAGYRYSGQGAAAGYGLVTGRRYRRIVVLAPSHYSGFHGFSLADATHFATPLGEVELDMEAVERLRQSSLHREVPGAHVEEHSIEIQLPLIQKLLAPTPVVPVLVGRLDRKEYPQLAEELRALIGPDTLLVASSDFTHQGPRFAYRPFASDLSENLRQLDFGAYEPIASLDPEGFLDYVDRTGITVCGYRPITLLLHLQEPTSQSHVVSYYTSGDLIGDWDNTVSYMTVIFQRPDPHPPFQERMLDAESRRVALRLARESVTRMTQGERPPAIPEDAPAALQAPGSCFVTLQKGTELRGCIGRIDSTGPLVESVISNARSAASEDPRFPRVTASELNEIKLEISVLTRPAPVAGPEHIELGRHGVILEKWGRRAVFLPQVAVDQVWTVEEMLDHLARKAGLGAGAWREGTRFEVFSCQVFSEGDADLSVGRETSGPEE